MIIKPFNQDPCIIKWRKTIIQRLGINSQRDDDQPNIWPPFMEKDFVYFANRVHWILSVLGGPHNFDFWTIFLNLVD